MNLFVMRHGQAQLNAITDKQRQLTERGFQEAEVMANWFNNQQLEISHVIVSPYVRAQQTAASFIETYQMPVSKEISDLYVPGGNAQQGQDYIDGSLNVRDAKGILIVSHMPMVSYLVESLTAGANSPIFETCGVAHIDYHIDNMTGELISLTSPSSLA